MVARRHPGLLFFDLASRAAYPLIVRHLKNRLAKGKEHPERWREKLGHDLAPRPSGRLIWLHAVGLGEVLALRAIISRLSSLHNTSFLVTSGTIASGKVFGANLPERTIHQFAPVDSPGPVDRFLDHWQPDISIWAEQDLWPAIVSRIDRRGIPLALINARMNAAAFEKRQRARGVFGDALRRMKLISAQDAATADHLSALGAGNVRIDGSLKPGAPELGADAGDLAEWKNRIGDRFVWCVGSSHMEDETLALAAHTRVLRSDPSALLILAPRNPARAGEPLVAAQDAGLSAILRSCDARPDTLPQVYIADTFGELGLWYRLASAVFVGGTMNEVEGHNPWEPAILGAPVLHGPRTANFTADFASLDAAGAAREVTIPAALAAALQSSELAAAANAAQSVVARESAKLDDLCAALAKLLATSH